MKKYLILALLLFLAGCAAKTNWPENEVCTKKDTKLAMSLTEATEIAKSSECAQLGTFKNFYCNDFTGTYWFDLEMYEPKEGCSPACVVNIESRTVEVNWRCTGLIPPKK